MMDIEAKKTCGDFAMLYDYINGGYIYDIMRLIQIVDDVKTKEKASEMISELKHSNPKLKCFFNKMEESKELRYILNSNLHDAVISDIIYNDNNMVMKLDLSEVITGFAIGNQIFDSIYITFNEIKKYESSKEFLVYRTITNIDVDILDDSIYSFIIDTYDCTPNSSDIYKCAELKIVCNEINIFTNVNRIK